MVSHLGPTKCFIEVLDASLKNEYIRLIWMGWIYITFSLIAGAWQPKLISS